MIQHYCAFFMILFIVFYFCVSGYLYSARGIYQFINQSFINHFISNLQINVRLCVSVDTITIVKRYKTTYVTIDQRHVVVLFCFYIFFLWMFFYHRLAHYKICVSAEQMNVRMEIGCDIQINHYHSPYFPTHITHGVTNILSNKRFGVLSVHIFIFVPKFFNTGGCQIL